MWLNFNIFFKMKRKWEEVEPLFDQWMKWDKCSKTRTELETLKGQDKPQFFFNESGTVD